MKLQMTIGERKLTAMWQAQRCKSRTQKNVKVFLEWLIAKNQCPKYIFRTQERKETQILLLLFTYKQLVVYQYSRRGRQWRWSHWCKSSYYKYKSGYCCCRSPSRSVNCYICRDTETDVRMWRIARWTCRGWWESRERRSRQTATPTTRISASSSPNNKEKKDDNLHKYKLHTSP